MDLIVAGISGFLWAYIVDRIKFKNEDHKFYFEWGGCFVIMVIIIAIDKCKRH